MAVFTIENLNFTYPGKNRPALDHIHLQIHPGEFLALCGRSGSGKSTLLRNMKPSLMPHGSRSGSILFYGTPIQQISQYMQAKRIGYVLQDPENQLVTDKVWHELAFGLESLGYDTSTIRLRVAEMASFFGIQGWFGKDVSRLSGGQKQLLNLAAVMAMQPDVLILDEPTSQLDPIAAGDFLDTVKKINRELGTTVIISEHRLEEVLPIADRAVVMDQGKIIADDTPANVGAILAQQGHEMFAAMPAPLQAYAMLYQKGIGRELECPIDIRSGRNWLTQLLKGKKLRAVKFRDGGEPDHEGEEPVIHMKDVWFRYGKDEPDVIKDLSLDVYAGEMFCMVGGNGTGKTTALTLMSGINRPYRGKVMVRGKDIIKYKNKQMFRGLLGVLPQNPQTIFAEKTVELDLLEMMEDMELSQEEKLEKLRRTAELTELTELLDMHPYDLSGGEQQRAALAKILLLEPEILLLDEPTKGLDNYFKKKLARILRDLQKQGVTIIMVSHDIEFCGKYADRCSMFFDGRIVTKGSPRSFFSGNSFYTTAANRMSRHIFENAITAEDIVKLCQFNLNHKEKKGGGTGSPPVDNEKKHQPKQEGTPIRKEPLLPAAHLNEVQEPPPKWKRRLGDLMLLILAPATILGGYFLLGDRKFYFISILLILYILIPFFAGFERKRPQARELMILAVMIAIAVAGRAAFFMIPQFKPILAIVIISGVSLGRQSGFLVGAMAAFVSNFMFGQGPWTPWQMFAMGIIGFLAGVLAEHGILGKKKLPLLIFGGAAAFLLYGLIVDLWTIFSMTAEPDLSVALGVYGAAVGFNAVHGVATVIFLWILAVPMKEKLDRTKQKYGMDAFTGAMQKG